MTSVGYPIRKTAEESASTILRTEITRRAPARSTRSRSRRRLEPVRVAMARRAMYMISYARQAISSRTSLQAKAKIGKKNLAYNMRRFGQLRMKKGRTKMQVMLCRMTYPLKCAVYNPLLRSSPSADRLLRASGETCRSTVAKRVKNRDAPLCVGWVGHMQGKRTSEQAVRAPLLVGPQLRFATKMDNEPLLIFLKSEGAPPRWRIECHLKGGRLYEWNFLMLINSLASWLLGSPKPAVSEQTPSSTSQESQSSQNTAPSAQVETPQETEANRACNSSVVRPRGKD
ncbi:hypothetical protein EOK75_01045 [Pseudorhodobacter turbinis]|uniref:Uncharacterized protein n=1 Tax=Pseudorhodobacter turbinis TaxID=2500533 RepID=A0A4P8EIH2_9RHOB|nr:hypothetical protein EOK75_01045 [Pseudorhodobacter turbinis]